MARLLPRLSSLLVLMVALPVAGLAQEEPAATDTLPPGEELPETAVPTQADTTEKDAPYVATNQRIVRRMLEVAGVSEDDVVYDLGSGDGRIPITAAKMFGARKAAGVSDQVEFRQQDLFKTDVSDATVVALYLWPEINVKLRPKLLRQLDPGDRIVSHDFRMGAWEPDRVVDAGQDKTGTATIYLWVVPKEVPDELMTAPAGPNEDT
jgi:hypothetical protein